MFLVDILKTSCCQRSCYQRSCYQRNCYQRDYYQKVVIAKVVIKVFMDNKNENNFVYTISYIIDSIV